MSFCTSSRYILDILSTRHDEILYFLFLDAAVRELLRLGGTGAAMTVGWDVPVAGARLSVGVLSATAEM